MQHLLLLGFWCRGCRRWCFEEGGVKGEDVGVVSVELPLRVLQVAEQAAEQLLSIMLHVAFKHGIELPVDMSSLGVIAHNEQLE